MSVAVQEFIIATAAGVSVEALVAAVRAALSRRPETGHDPQGARDAERISITARQTGDGLVEVTVTIEKPEA